jgi:hypothetical protein
MMRLPQSMSCWLSSGGHAQEAGEDVDGEVGGDLAHEVEGALGQRVVEGGGGQAAQEAGVAVDDARAELALEQAAHRAVADAVEFQEGGAFLDLVVVGLFEVDEPRGGEGLGVAVDAGDVGVPGDGPETGVGGLLGLPVDGVLVAQGVEHPPGGHPVGEVVEVREIDVGEGQGLTRGVRRGPGGRGHGVGSPRCHRW